MIVLKFKLQIQINIIQIILVFLFGAVNSDLIGQQAIPAVGGTALGSGGSVSYSVGQVVYTTKNSSGGTVLEGVQQTYEISIISGVDDAKLITLSCSVFPNPVISHLTLRVEENFSHQLAYQLYTLNGQSLHSAKIVSPETTISMENLSSGLYFLRIIETKGNMPLTDLSLRVLKIFKIIKN